MLTSRAGRDPGRDAGRVPLRRHTWTLRRLASAGLVAAAFGVGLLALSPDAPAGSPVLLAAHDLAAGTVLGAGDVRVASRPSAQLPQGSLAGTGTVVGRVLASGARSGEVLTDVRLVGPSLVDGLPPGDVASPVRVADAAAAGLVGPGDHVDILLAVEAGGPAQTIVRDAIVLARPQRETGGGLVGGPGDDGQGGLLVLGVRDDGARALAGAAAQGPLSLALRGS